MRAGDGRPRGRRRRGIRLIYQHGRFAPRDTSATALALELYVIGMPAYAAVKVMAPVCYAADRTRLAVIASLTAVAGNLAINASLHLRYGFRALAVGTQLLNYLLKEKYNVIKRRLPVSIMKGEIISPLY